MRYLQSNKNVSYHVISNATEIDNFELFVKVTLSIALGETIQYYWACGIFMSLCQFSFKNAKLYRAKSYFLYYCRSFSS